MLNLSIIKNGLILGIFALATVGLCVFTFTYTKDRISDQKKRALERALVEIVAEDQHSNDMLQDTVMVQSPLLGSEEKRVAYLARQNGEPAAAVFQVAAPEGYGGTINLLIGVNFDGTVAGVRVVPPHPETPGLGDQIETKKSDWIKSFTGLSLQHPKEASWKVKKDGGAFDSFTGATITPRAVVKATYQTLKYFEDNKYTLFGTQPHEEDMGSLGESQRSSSHSRLPLKLKEEKHNG